MTLSGIGVKIRTDKGVDIVPSKLDKVPIDNPKHDKRVKLSNEDRDNIREEYVCGNISQNGLAKKYGVSKRLIQFVLYPEKQEVARKQFLERQKDGRYYNKDKHREYMKQHREHKKELYNKGLIK